MTSGSGNRRLLRRLPASPNAGCASTCTRALAGCETEAEAGLGDRVQAVALYVGG